MVAALVLPECYSSVSIATAWGRPLEVLVAGTNLGLGLVSKSINTITPVQSHSNLLVSVDETLQLGVQLDVLTGKNVAVVLQGIDF